MQSKLTFWVLTAGFVLFIIFLYGPMIAIFILSFQGPIGGMTFPLRGVSLHWFADLFASSRDGDLGIAFTRSITLGLLAMIITVTVSFFAGLGFRRKFRGSGALFYLAIISQVMPGVLTGLGIGTLFTTLGLQNNWQISGLGAHLTWTLPFGLLIMFAVLNRFDGSWEEAARDAGASRKQVLKQVTLSILFPDLIAVALFDLTLSYDEFPRSLLTVGTKNTLPLQMASLTTALSLVVIAVAFAAIALTGRKR